MRRNKVNDNDGGGGGEDTWIWGNTRGGGGAPLKNINGETITNLKKVMNGTIEVDYNSPSHHQSSNNRRNDYNSPNRRNNDSPERRNEERYHSPIKGNEYIARGHKNINIDDSERETKARLINLFFKHFLNYFYLSFSNLSNKIEKQEIIKNNYVNKLKKKNDKKNLNKEN